MTTVPAVLTGSTGRVIRSIGGRGGQQVCRTGSRGRFPGSRLVDDMIGRKVDPADQQIGVDDAVIEAQHSLRDLSGGGCVPAQIHSAVGGFGGVAAVPVFFDRPLVFPADLRIGQILVVIDDSQDKLVCQKAFFHKVQGGAVRHFTHDNAGFFRAVGALQHLAGAEGAVLRLICLDEVDCAGFPAPGVIDEKLGIDTEQLVEQILVLEGASGDVPHGKHAVAGELLRSSLSDAPEIRYGTVAPELSAVAHLVQLRDAHTVRVRGGVLGFDIHRDLTQVEVGPNARGGCDSCLFQNRADHLHRQLMSSLFVEREIPGHIHHDFVDGVDVDILRRDVAEIDLVDSRAVFDVVGHAGNRYDIVRLERGIRGKLRRGKRTSGERNS